MIENQHEVTRRMSTVEKEVVESAEELAEEGHAAEETIVEENAADKHDNEELSAEEQQTLRLKIEEKVAKYFQNKEIARERSEENKLLFEEMEELFQSSGAEEIKVTLPSGEDAVLSPKVSEKEVLDKDLLADEMQVPKDELKTPFDFCIFTAQGKLTPAMITKHTTVVREIKMKIAKRKPKSRRRK
jgi:hypothetical protein